MNILAFDSGTKCGWATLMDGKIESGVQEFTLQRGESPGMKYLRFRVWLRAIFDLVKPDLAGFEQAHHRGGFTTDLLIGMNTRIEEECAGRGIEHTSVHSAILKKFATGSGRASKEEMVAEASRRFEREIIDHNEADALLILAFLMEKFVERG